MLANHRFFVVNYIQQNEIGRNDTNSPFPTISRKDRDPYE